MLSFIPTFKAQSGLNTGEGAPLPNAINLCLFISVNYQIFDNTFLTVDQIGRSGPTFPYIDGGVSISRTARTYPTFLIFKPAMILTSIFLIIYWIKTNRIINFYQNLENNNSIST